MYYYEGKRKSIDEYNKLELNPYKRNSSIIINEVATYLRKF